MRVSLFTREYPPEVYGGAGVHVEYLSRELARRVELTVHCWGSDRDEPADLGEPAERGQPVIRRYSPWDELAGGAPSLAALQAVSIDLLMAAAARSAELVHSHTWYAQFGGHLAKLMYDIPHVATVHSLEPLRPWKAEQLGGGYAISSFCERVSLEAADAVIAVSQGSRRDILSCYPAIAPDRVHVVYNGIDTAEFAPDPRTDMLHRLGVDPDRPIVTFVGRITRQKGVPLLLRAAADFDPATQLVLCAGSPDTPEIGVEVAAGVAHLQASRDGVIWIREMLPRADVIQLLSHSTVFACPSIYEPLGIVNLEAMACETAVVASATGGIVEVVRDGETGFLVKLERSGDSLEPDDPAAFAAEFAERVNQLVSDPELAREMGRAGRVRAREHFSWSVIADEVVALYHDVLEKRI